MNSVRQPSWREVSSRDLRSCRGFLPYCSFPERTTSSYYRTRPLFHPRLLTGVLIKLPPPWGALDVGTPAGAGVGDGPPKILAEAKIPRVKGTAWPKDRRTLSEGGRGKSLGPGSDRWNGELLPQKSPPRINQSLFEGVTEVSRLKTRFEIGGPGI